MKYRTPRQKKRKRGLDKSAPLILVLGIFLACLPGRAQEDEEEEFRGAGIHLRLYGAWITFAGGDLREGIAGMSDRASSGLFSAGFELREEEMKAFTSGYELGGDLIYWLSPRVGIGVGGSLARRDSWNSILFRWPGMTVEYRMTGVPELKVFSFRAGLFLSLPLNRMITLCASAGPARYSAEFRYTGQVQTPIIIDSIHQEAKAGHWGVQGGIGLEVRMNRRLSFVLAAMGRSATVSGFKGKEATNYWEDSQSVTVHKNGTLYLVESEEFPRLAVIQGSLPDDLKARKAEFDFSGLSLQAGLTFKL